MKNGKKGGFFVDFQECHYTALVEVGVPNSRANKSYTPEKGSKGVIWGSKTPPAGPPRKHPFSPLSRNRVFS